MSKKSKARPIVWPIISSKVLGRLLERRYRRHDYAASQRNLFHQAEMAMVKRRFDGP